MSANVQTTVHCPLVVTNVTLTIDYVVGAWVAALSHTIAQNLQISDMTTSGFTACGTAAIQYDSIVNTLNILSNTTTNQQINNGLNCTSKRFTVGNSGKLNNINIYDGAVVHIGIYTITVNILNTNCSKYFCA